jgi:hypothetical protein
MTNLRKLKKLLVRSLEEPLGNKDQQLLDAGLESSAELQKEKLEILKLRKNLSTIEAGFSKNFEQKVMNAIRMEKSLTSNFEILPIFRAVAFSGIAAILIVLIGVYFADGSLNFDSIMGISRYAPDLGLLAFF